MDTSVSHGADAAERGRAGRIPEQWDLAARTEEITHIGSWEVDLLTEESVWSAETYRLFGLDPAQTTPNLALGMKSVHPEDFDRVQEAVRTSRETGQLVLGDFRIVRPDGEVREMRAEGTVRLDPEGRQTHLYGFLQDVTERNRIERQLKAQAHIIDQIHDAVVSMDLDGYITNWNEGAVRRYGYTRDEVLGQHVRTLYFDEDIAALEDEIIPQLLEQGELLTERRARHKSGAELYIQLSLSLLHAEDGTVTGMIGYSLDITERRQQEATLLTQRKITNAIAQAQSEFIQGARRDTSFDTLLYDILELTASQYGFIGEVLSTPEGDPYLKTFAITNIAWDESTRSYYETNAPAGMEFFNLDTLFGAALRTGEPVIANDPASDPRSGGLPAGHPPLNAFLGIPIHRDGQFKAMVGIANRPGGYTREILGLLHPILVTIGQLAEAGQVQDALRDSERRLGLVFNAASDLQCLFRPGEGGDWVYEAANRSYMDYLRSVSAECPDDVAGWTRRKLFALLKVPREATEVERPYYEEVWETRRTAHYDVPINTSEGRRHFEVALEPVLDERGNCTHVLWSGRDVTEYVRARQDAERSLREKETLLKEIHHRVKNNLQIISSLLNLQAHSIEDDAVRMVFEESKNRVSTMALIHEKLYRTEDLARINFADYLRSLMDTIATGYVSDDRPIGLEVDADEFTLDIDTVIPCALIVNELISNAMKHAFRDGPPVGGAPPKVCVRLGEAEKGHYTLRVRDNGSGFPDGLDVEHSETLGLQIVNALTQQLDGQVEWHNDGGAVIALHWRRSPQRQETTS